jgi:serine/threonine protein kinase/Tfp pilus assembly protein PilF
MSGTNSGSDPLGRLADEFLARYRRGERPALTEYATRYPDLAAQIRELFPALALLEDVRPDPQTTAATTTDAGPPRRLGEYRIVREIGRGGMGVVYEAEQESLSRRVALKVLPPGVLGDARHVERFQLEARAAARLHHSSIVPVFAVGEQDGTHYFVMQYIEGRPLDEVLAELRLLRIEADIGSGPKTEKGSSAAEPPPAVGPSSAAVARSLWQGQFSLAGRTDGAGAAAPDDERRLSKRGSSAEAPVAKSSNLLSNPQRPYAKSVAQIGIQIAEALEYAAGQRVLHRDVKPSNLLLDVWGTVWLTDFGLAKAAGSPDLTRTGDLLGTLRYMAPERFEGRGDVRSDVYSLGLTLFELLTLQPAFAESDRAELIWHITRAEMPRLDRTNPHLPRDLVTIVHKAIARDPADRYQTAAALAEDLRRFLDDRSIVARRASLPEQAWRWCRRNPTGAALAAVLLALFFLAAGGGVWLERQQAERMGRAREAVEAALAQVPGLRRQGRWPEAQAVLAQAVSRLDDANSEALRRRLRQAEADVNLAAVLEQIRLTPASERGRLDYQGMAGAYARAFTSAGLDVRGDENSLAARIQDSDVRANLITALDHWAFVADALRDGAMRARLLDLARRANPDAAWGDRVRAQEVWADPEQLRRLAAEARERLADAAPGKGPPTPLVILLARKLAQQEGEAEPLLRAAQRRRPEDFWLNYELGEALRERKPAEAVGFYRAALATRPQVARVYHEFGMALFRLGQSEEAISALQKAISLEPKATPAYNNLGLILLSEGKLERAIAEFRRAIDLDPNVAALHRNLGLCLQNQGRWDEATAAFRRVTQLDPQEDQAHCLLGNCLQDRGQWDEAMAAYRRAIQLNPKAAAAHYQLGVLLRARSRLEKAIWEFRQAVNFDPSGAQGHEALADALLRLGRFDEARAAAQRGLDLLPGHEPSRKTLRQIHEQCGRMIALDAQLPALLQGEKPAADAAKHLKLARSCRDKGRPFAAARLYAVAFAARPALADDLSSNNRSDAACAALRAATRDADGAPLGEPERAGLRRQALGWLRADLAQRTKLMQAGKSEGRTLATWQTDDALAGVRDREALAKLPDDERAEWQHFWAGVAVALADDPLEQAWSYSARREWGRAADAYARAWKRAPREDGHFWFEYAAVLLLSGDREGYTKACTHMVDRVERYGKTKQLRPYHVARACTLAPASAADVARARRLAESELTGQGREFWSLTQQGALLYRAGRFQEAVPLLEQSLRADAKNGRAVLNWLWLALANQRLGKAEESRNWLARAREWLGQYRDGMPDHAEEELGLHLHNWLEAHALLREAEALLGTRPNTSK